MGFIDRLYSTVFQEDEDTRVCTDISEAACTGVPGNFTRILASSTATSVSDEMASAKTVLPWLLSSLGASPFWIGLLVPVRESMSLLPQLFIAGSVRRMPRRKTAWIIGGVLQALMLAAVAATAFWAGGPWSGALVVGFVLLFSLARGLTSIASKDVIGKTIPKRRRGRLTGAKSAVAGLLTLGVGSLVVRYIGDGARPEAIALLVMGAAALWLIASGIFALVDEEPGAVEGGRNGFPEAVKRLAVIKTDPAFRRFVLTRALFVSTALAGPYYVILAREYSSGGALLGFFILASGLASALSSVIWGAFADRSSRNVLVFAAASASVLGAAMFAMDRTGALRAAPWIAPVTFFLLSVAHAGVRIGRKTYILDLAGGQKRTDYVAVGNTVIGIVLLLSSLVGTLSGLVGYSGVLLILAVFGLLGVALGFGLPQVE